VTRAISPPEDRRALSETKNLEDRVKEWKRLRCPDHACCSPATLGLGLHAINQLRSEQGLFALRADQLAPSHPCYSIRPAEPDAPPPAARATSIAGRASLARPLTEDTPERERAGKE
jgi:hypothetical protein